MSAYKPFTKKQLEHAKNHMGPNWKEDLRNRQMGKSTGIALSTIGEAMQSPGVEVRIRDHFRGYSADECLSQTIISIISKLRLEGFTVRSIYADFTLVYKLDFSDLDAL